MLAMPERNKPSVYVVLAMNSCVELSMLHPTSGTFQVTFIRVLKAFEHQVGLEGRKSATPVRRPPEDLDGQSRAKRVQPRMSTPKVSVGLSIATTGDQAHACQCRPAVR